MDDCGVRFAHLGCNVGFGQYQVQSAETIDIICCSGEKVVMIEKIFLRKDCADHTDMVAIDVESKFLASGSSFE